MEPPDDCDWIIPAYAGNTLSRLLGGTVVRDHPRVCGEHGMALIGAAFNSGSSPRMRGTLINIILPICLTGIIPAYAGNTSLSAHADSAKRDHPRVCGEHRGDSIICATKRGSSPRMRGTQAGRIIRIQMQGIIPAYAGNTLTSYYALGYLRDHPRVCGEHIMFLAMSAVR